MTCTADTFFPLQEDPEIAFTDEDYRRRKAHPNFTDHINAEKLILKLGKTVRKNCVYKNSLFGLLTDRIILVKEIINNLNI